MKNTQNSVLTVEQANYVSAIIIRALAKGEIKAEKARAILAALRPPQKNTP